METKKALAVIIILLIMITFMLFLQTNYMLSDDVYHEDVEPLNYTGVKLCKSDMNVHSLMLKI